MRFIPLFSLVLAIFVLPTVTISPLYGEVQQVTLIWQPGLCGAPCVKLLYNHLGKIPGVESVDINQGAGRGFLVWGKNTPFAFAPINAASRWVGIRVDLILLKVRGHIIEKGSDLILISEGDNTAFVLINPVIPQKNRSAVIYNPQYRQLKEELRNQLLEAMKAKHLVVIEGPFFEPFRSPPNILTVEKLTVENPEPAKQPQSYTTPSRPNSNYINSDYDPERPRKK